MNKHFTFNIHSALQKYKAGLKWSCSLIVFVMLQLNLFAQTGRDITVNGKVTSATGEALNGVTIKVKNSTLTTTTNASGDFTITVPENAVLQVSYVGFTSQDFAVAGKTSVNITLGAGVSDMSEVVVVGYSSQRKASISGAVSSVNINDLSKTRIADVAQALQGQVAGVVVSANTGAPGDGIKVRIRGEGTLGVNDALYVVDGVATRDISFLNMADVQSMTVLKDASAAAIYGSRAAGGVVVITTKSGQKGKSNIDVEYNTGFYNATNLPKMLNAEQYLTVKDMAWHNTAGNAPGATSPYAADRDTNQRLANTNWQKELFNTGRSQQVQVSASGGSDNTQYLLSVGYFGQDGIIVEDHDMYQRFNFRANINSSLSKRFKVGTNINVSYAKQDKLSSSGDVPGIIRHALIRPPVISVFKNPTDPGYSVSNPYTDLPFYTGPADGWSKIYEYSSNPLAIVHFTNDKRNTYQTFGNVYAEYGFLKNNELKFKSSMGVDIAFSHNKNFARNFGDANISDPTNQYYGQGRNNRPNNLDENRGENMTFTFTNTLNYQKNISGVHSINAVLGTEFINNKASGIGGSRQNFNLYSPAFQYLDYGSRTDAYSGGNASSFALLSHFASGTYGYANKYYATATIRADASSRFGPNNKWGYFPSVSAGWIVSNEDFMKNSNAISNLKLRGSWGQAGNQEIPNNVYQTLVTEANGSPIVTRYGNPDIQWETTTQSNIGVDVGVLKDRLSFSADYFVKRTDGILLTVMLPVVSVGIIDRTYVNAGQVTNKGFEFSANYRNNDHAFKWNVNANLSTVSNNVDKLQTYVKDLNDDATHTKTTVGQPISSYYGLVFDGIYQNAAEVSSHLFSNVNGTQPGDIRFKDLNADGQINADDRAFIGNPIPKLTYGLAFSSSYKNFDFSFLVQGVNDVDRYNDLKQILNYDSRPFNSTTAVLDSWHGEGTSNTTPRVTFNNNGGGNVSSVFIEDASYIRLKNIEVGYTFNTKKLGVKNLRLYASGQNVLTGTDYTGLDPESNSLIDKGTYPQSKAFIIGAKIRL